MLDKYLMVDFRPYIKYMPNQFGVQCCTASASLLAAEIILSMNSATTNLSRLYTYFMTRKIQNRIGLHGADLNYTMESLAKFGSCPESQWPFEVRRVDHHPTLQCQQDATRFLLDEYTRISPACITATLDQGYPVIAGMFTGRRFWKLESKEVYHPINTSDNRQSKGHAVTIVGYNSDGWIIANSLGTQWGDRGYGVMSVDCVSDIGEAFVIKKFAGLSPK